MIYVPNDNHDPALNLAMEEYILTSGTILNPVLFFYINEPSIIVGRHQNTFDEINSGYVNEHNIKVVRRCSGGGAVYHDFGNLNYSLIHPGDNRATADFGVLLKPILSALRHLGLQAELGGRNDLLLDGAKFSGNAYYHNRYGSVTHGTLLFNTDLTVLSKALRPAPQKLQSKGIHSIRSRVCCIKDALPCISDAGDLKAAIIRYFKEHYGLSTYSVTENDTQKAEALASDRYRNDLWNYGESPAYTLRRLIHTSEGWIDFRADIRKNIVCNVRFFGDFFCSRNINELEEAFSGLEWEKYSIESTLNTAKWEEFFPSYPLKTFAETIFSKTTNA